jgi:hypothetical protein
MRRYVDVDLRSLALRAVEADCAASLLQAAHRDKLTWALGSAEGPCTMKCRKCTLGCAADRAVVLHIAVEGLPVIHAAEHLRRPVPAEESEGLANFHTITPTQSPSLFIAITEQPNTREQPTRK